MTAIPYEVRIFVLRRDGWKCIAPQVDGHSDWCRDMWGNVITHWPARDRGPQYVQMSHIKMADELAMGKKAPPDAHHLVTLCPWHHNATVAGSNWEARHRDTIRKHLMELRNYR